LEEIEENGFAAKGVQFRQLSGKLWEIKIRAPSGGYRFLYVILEKSLLLILHAFKKKTQKTPLRELKIAQMRLQEIL
jgi:phage-related protein